MIFSLKSCRVLTSARCLRMQVHRPCTNIISRRWKSDSVVNEKSKQMHDEIKGVMGKPSAPKGVSAQIFQNPDRKARYTQALWNMAASFLLVMMAAQTVKSANERRKSEKEKVEATEQLEANRMTLKKLLGKDLYRPLAEKVSKTMTSAPKSKGWFGSNKPQQDDDELLKERIAGMVQQEIQKVIGDAALTEAERDAYAINKMQTPEGLLSENPEAALKELETTSVEKDETGATVVKKRVFSI